MRRPLLLLAGLFLLLAGRAAAQPAAIDVEHSTMTVHVFKAGMLSAFGHNHEVRAPIADGTVDEAARAVWLRVESHRLQVVDTEVSDKDRNDVQSTMQGPQVLDSEHFPEIRFRSTAVTPAGEGQWLVRGDLTLHGQTHPVEMKVSRGGGHYRGAATLKQRDFGITPVSVAGGSVKVKDELKIEFDIVTAAAAPAPAHNRP